MKKPSKRSRIIDFRCRLTTVEAAAYYHERMRKAERLHEVPALADGSEKAFFQALDEAGVTTAVSVSGFNPGCAIGRHVYPDRTTPNDLLADVQRRHKGRFIGVAGIDAGGVFHQPMAEIERCVHELGLAAVYLEPGRSPGCLPSDERLYPIYRRCMEFDLPVVLQTSGPRGGASLDYANPLHIDRIATLFPDLHIICAHGCYPFVREAIVVAGRHQNVWMSPDTYFFAPGQEDWMRAVNEDHLGFSNRFLFGSASPLRALTPSVEEFLGLSWQEEILEPILWSNALEALNLNQELFTKMADDRDGLG